MALTLEEALESRRVCVAFQEARKREEALRAAREQKRREHEKALQKAKEMQLLVDKAVRDNMCTLCATGQAFVQQRVGRHL